MGEFFSNYFLPGPALAVLGIYVAVVNYFKWDELAKLVDRFRPSFGRYFAWHCGYRGNDDQRGRTSLRCA